MDLHSKWGFSSAGRASALQAEGHRFDPDKLHWMIFFINTLYIDKRIKKICYQKFDQIIWNNSIQIKNRSRNEYCKLKLY